jgi:very-short-patch-repair endonuclease
VSHLALTGPAAAAIYELDGFTNHVWPLLWCGRISLEPAPNLIRSRRFRSPRLVNDQWVTRPSLVLRHLNALEDRHYDLADGVSRRDRVELATESAFRKGLVRRGEMTFTGGPQLGGHYLREIIHARANEPPTESYAETRMQQLLRSMGLLSWRQARIYEAGRIRFRCDFAVALRRTQLRPTYFLPHLVLLIEVDSREFHDNESTFEADHHRYATYETLGYSYLAFTPTQIEKYPDFVKRVIRSRLRRLKSRYASAA